MKKIYLFSALFFGYQPPLYAYLDPASGSMLLSALIGIIATLFFSMKEFFYKIKSTIFSFFGVKLEKNICELVFYSEGKQYWNTFKPILESLDKRNIEAVYLTSSEDDLGLNYEGKNIKTLYIGKGNSAYTYLNTLEAQICVMTTPGLDVLQIKRSKGVQHYSYVNHSPIDMGKYKLYSFDCFDSIFLSGVHQERSIRTLEAIRGTKRKQLINAGCPYIDELALRADLERKITQASKDSRKTVLIAPTWGENNFLKLFGSTPIKQLLEDGYEVIVRPHPQSYQSEPELYAKIKSELNIFENLFWDDRPDNFFSLSKSDVLISDMSGVIFDYAFVFEKPVITVVLDYDFLGQEANDLPHELWELSVLNKIGKRINSKDLKNISNVVQRVLSDSYDKSNAEKLREESLYNYKNSGEIIASYLSEIMKEVDK
jgi:CDP-glycerol glycerophosphotransferase (TagB/SpsB family)